MADFDALANNYDKTFTHTPVGLAQRSIVRNHLLTALPAHSLRILELNCGTGEDAVWLAGKGHNVTASDGSEMMLEVARKKARANNVQIDFLQWNLTQAFPRSGITYDIIFSNFGGLNCLSSAQLKTLFTQTDALLNPNGKCIIVLMGKFCLSESIYYLLKLKFNSILRRRKMQKVTLQSGEVVSTWYYSQSELTTLVPDTWIKTKRIPIGITIPPSYLNAFFERHPYVFKLLIRADRTLRRWEALSRLSDHYLISFKKQQV